MKQEDSGKIIEHILELLFDSELIDSERENMIRKKLPLLEDANLVKLHKLLKYADKKQKLLNSAFSKKVAELNDQYDSAISDCLTRMQDSLREKESAEEDTQLDDLLNQL